MCVAIAGDLAVGEDLYIGSTQGLLDLADGQLAEMEHTSRQHCVCPCLYRGKKVLKFSRASAGDDRAQKRRLAHESQ